MYVSNSSGSWFVKNLIITNGSINDILILNEAYDGQSCTNKKLMSLNDSINQ